VDTPPVIHARDLLSAPSRLAALVDTDAARVLANPAIALARAGSRLAKTSAALLLPLLERVTGSDCVAEVARFKSPDFESVLLGLTERDESGGVLLAGVRHGVCRRRTPGRRERGGTRAIRRSSPHARSASTPSSLTASPSARTRQSSGRSSNGLEELPKGREGGA